MELAILKADGITHLFRWAHFMFGIVWIGMLYYFNFVQTPFFAETDGNTKSGVVQKLVPRALWWFRFGALFTWLSGICLLYLRAKEVAAGASMMAAFNSNWGALILTGGLLGTIMALNVWFIIWPAQQVVIASAVAVAGGGKADPSAADRGARAGVASRTNTLFSIPLLFFMGAAPHLGIQVNQGVSFMPLTIAMLVIVGLLEINAIKGKLGPMKSVAGVIHMGLLLTIVMYGLIEFLTK